MNTIEFGYSTAFDCTSKTVKPGYRTGDAWQRFTTRRDTVEAFADHILKGGSFTPGIFKEGIRRTDDFMRAWVIAIDIDDSPPTEMLAAHPLIRQYAAMIYRTPSYTDSKPKHRVVFVLDEPIDHPERYRTLVKGVMRDMGLNADPASIKPAQPYFGTLKGGIVRPENRLPLKLAGGFCLEEATEDYLRLTSHDAPKRAYTGDDQTYVQRFIDSAIDAECHTLSTATDGSRTETLKNATIALYGFVAAGLIDEGTVYRALESAALKSGLGERKVQHTIKSCAKYAKARTIPEPKHPKYQEQPAYPFFDTGAEASQEDLGCIKLRIEEAPDFPSTDYEQLQPPGEEIVGPEPFRPTYNPPHLNADLTFNAPYVNQCPDLPMQGVVAIIADKGTGKTEFGANVITHYKKQGKERAMVITPLITLTQAASERYDLQSYEGLTREQRRQAAMMGLAITLNSIEGFATMEGEEFPRPEVLILDEFSKLISATLSRKLFPKGKANRVLGVLKRLIQTADVVLIMDADLQQWHADWLKSIRQDVFTALNTFSRDAGEMTAHETEEALELELSNAVARNDGPIIAVANTRSQVEKWDEAFSRLFGEDKVLSIHSRNSTNPKQRQFLADIARKRPDGSKDHDAERKALEQYRVIFLSPSANTGVDIQTRIRAKFGKFLNKNSLDAAGCSQLLERARNADHTHVFIQRAEGNRLTNAVAIYDRYRRATLNTIYLCGVNEEGQLDFDGIVKELHTLHSYAAADRNASLNHLYENFLNLAARNYTISFKGGEAPEKALERVKEAGRTLKERRREKVLTIAPMPPEEHREKSGRGQRTDDDNYALERWHIEDFFKATIDEALYDFDGNGKGRERLSLYIDVFHAKPYELKALDAQEHADTSPVMHYQHHAMKQRVIQQFLLDVWGSRDSFTPETVYEEKTIRDRVAAHLQQHEKLLNLYTGIRPDSSRDEMDFTRRVFRAIGLRLIEVNRNNRDENTPRRYRLDGGRLEQIEAYAQRRLKALADEQRESLSDRFQGVQVQDSVVITYTPAPLPSFIAQRLAQGIPLNPFSSAWRKVEEVQHVEYATV